MQRKQNLMILAVVLPLVVVLVWFYEDNDSFLPNGVWVKSISTNTTENTHTKRYFVLDHVDVTNVQQISSETTIALVLVNNTSHLRKQSLPSNQYKTTRKSEKSVFNKNSNTSITLGHVGGNVSDYKLIKSVYNSAGISQEKTHSASTSEQPRHGGSDNRTNITTDRILPRYSDHPLNSTQKIEDKHDYSKGVTKSEDQLGSPSNNSSFMKDLTNINIPFLSYPMIPRIVNDTRRDRMDELMSSIDAMFNYNNITYILAYGTLLGSYFTHGILPWDDDLDIIVRASHYDKIKGIDFTKDSTSKDKMTYFVHEKQGYPKMKLYFESDLAAGDHVYNWPFCDIVTFTDNATHVWVDHDPKINSLREDFYPLHLRPLGKLWLPVARKPQVWLKKRYNTFSCKTHYWNHIHEKSSKKIYKAKCDSIEEYYPVVHRVVQAGGVQETLKLNNTELYTIWLDEPHEESAGWDFL